MSSKKTASKKAEVLVENIAEPSVAKGAEKKAIRVVKAATKAAPKQEEPKKIPLSRFVCEHLLKGTSDEEIIEAMKEDYADKDCSMKTVSWYRFAINKGRMEKIGFPAPEGGLLNPRRVAAAEKKAVAAEEKAARADKVEKVAKVARVATSKKIAPVKVAPVKVARRKPSA